MTEKFCGLCQRRHWYQATPEVSAPRRETFVDFALAFVVWGLVIAAYISVGLWVASHV
jgi:hypothetical protein